MNNFFYGIVEDRDDPLKIGRVRVRVHGLHTDDKKLIRKAFEIAVDAHKEQRRKSGERCRDGFGQRRDTGTW